MSDYSPLLGRPADPRLLARVDIDEKVPQALDAVAHVAGSDVVLVGAEGDHLARRLAPLAASVTLVADPACVDEVAGMLQQADAARPSIPVVAGSPRATGLSEASADVVIGGWTVYRGVDPQEQAEADRVLRPGGRLAILHDYGRDDLSGMGAPDRPEIVSWSRRGGPFLRAGFKIRVVHGWCSFDSAEEAAGLLEGSFGPAGAELAASLKRPRLSYNIAIYHRSRTDS